MPCILAQGTDFLQACRQGHEFLMEILGGRKGWAHKLGDSCSSESSTPLSERRVQGEISSPVPGRPMTKEASKRPGKLRMVFSYHSLTAFGRQRGFGSLKRPRWHLDIIVLVIAWRDLPHLSDCSWAVGYQCTWARCKCISESRVQGERVVQVPWQVQLGPV